MQGAGTAGLMWPIMVQAGNKGCNEVQGKITMVSYRMFYSDFNLLATAY